MTEERPQSQTFGELADELLACRLRFRFQARGRSMLPVIGDGQILHVQPANATRLKVGDIVLFRQDTKFKAHRIIRKHTDQFITRGDASREADGGITGGQIVGKIVAKECMKSGAMVRLDSLAVRLSFFAAESRRQARKYLSRPLVSRLQHSSFFPWSPWLFLLLIARWRLTLRRRLFLPPLPMPQAETRCARAQSRVEPATHSLE